MAVIVTLAKLSLAVGLALTMSTSAGAVVSVGLVQIGGTYDPTVGAHVGDTLVLDITYSFGPGDAVTLLDPGIVWDGAVSSFDATGSTETGLALFSGGDILFDPIATGDVRLAPQGLGFLENLADGWEKHSNFGGGASDPCVFGACSSLGTAAFVLSGADGVIRIGAVGQPFGTVIGDADYQDIAPISNLGSFQIISNPEPSTALLLAFGLMGIAAGRRRRGRRSSISGV
jgi:hypothetical protein